MARKTAQVATCCEERPECTCPQCTGLECLERPRFFAGQLLTEAELNGQQAWIQAKNRLHNLHLHGWGVVCGLEVVCHECEGWVTVRPGYAIDPCGEDVIVCQDHDLDVMALIRECKEARRRKRRADCEPIRPRPEKPPSEEHWCLRLSYLETEGRPKTTLRRECCDRCGCGPGCTCSCGCHEDKGHSHCGCSHGPARARPGMGKVAACEPTRILETYRLELCETPEDFCDCFESEAEKAYRERFEKCFEALQRDFKRAPENALRNVADVSFDELDIRAGVGTPREELTAEALHQSYRDAYEWVRDLFRRHPGNTHCALVDELERLDAPRPEPNDDVTVYSNRLRQPSRDLWNLLVVYLVDCLCWAALPPCAPCCPGDDELILACLTIKDGKIEHICNYSCRRYAGAFPPSVKGIYLGPFMPLVLKALKSLCCDDWFERVFNNARLPGWQRNAVSLMAADNLARSDVLLDGVRNLGLEALFPAVDPTALNAATLVGRSVEEAHATTSQYGVAVEVREVDTRARLDFLDALGQVRRGERLVLFAYQDEVTGIARAGSTDERIVAQGNELRALRTELKTLKTEVEKLRGGPG